MTGVTCAFRNIFPLFVLGGALKLKEDLRSNGTNNILNLQTMVLETSDRLQTCKKNKLEPGVLTNVHIEELSTKEN